MSSNQFWRECNRHYTAEKEQAHRKKGFAEKEEIRVIRSAELSKVHI
jgi:hypothetical protein